MSKATKNERISTLERQVTALITLVKMKGYNESEPQLKQLDQSVFKNMHERWRFAAIDADGSANGFSKEVFPYREGFCYEGEDYSEFKFSLIGKGYDASDWQNSLIEREKKELTGSELCRAMLGRSNEYVMCLVGDECEESAKNSEIVRVICSRGADYF